MKCHRCEKLSTYSKVYKKTYYGEMQDYDKWVTYPVNPSLHRQCAHEWLQCNSKSSRDVHFKEHGVQWSELLRLPYMDPIRFAVVDQDPEYLSFNLDIYIVNFLTCDNLVNIKDIRIKFIPLDFSH